MHHTVLLGASFGYTSHVFGFLMRNIMSDLRNKFGKKLRRIRRDRDMTQEQLAEAIGVTLDFISRMERGLDAASFETLDKLAKALGVPVSELFQFPEDK
jgi:DNA-binding XRE family transcriptional regulator